MRNNKQTLLRNCAAVVPKSFTIEISGLKPARTKLRLHSKAKLATLARSLEQFGQIEPIVINGSNVIAHGHARVEAAKRLGWREIGAVRVAPSTPVFRSSTFRALSKAGEIRR